MVLGPRGFESYPSVDDKYLQLTQPQPVRSRREITAGIKTACDVGVGRPNPLNAVIVPTHAVHIDKRCMRGCAHVPLFLWCGRSKVMLARWGLASVSD